MKYFWISHAFWEYCHLVSSSPEGKPHRDKQRWDLTLEWPDDLEIFYLKFQFDCFSQWLLVTVDILHLVSVGMWNYVIEAEMIPFSELNWPLPYHHGSLILLHWAFTSLPLPHHSIDNKYLTSTLIYYCEVRHHAKLNIALKKRNFGYFSRLTHQCALLHFRPTCFGDWGFWNCQICPKLELNSIAVYHQTSSVGCD